MDKQIFSIKGTFRIHYSPIASDSWVIHHEESNKKFRVKNVSILSASKTDGPLQTAEKAKFFIKVENSKLTFSDDEQQNAFIAPLPLINKILKL